MLAVSWSRHSTRPHALCVHRETCGDVAVLERDGAFYACGHLVDDGHLIGNLCDRSLAGLSSDRRMLAFGEAKRGSLPQVCRGCEVLASCNGCCPPRRAHEGGQNTAVVHLSLSVRGIPASIRFIAVPPGYATT